MCARAFPRVSLRVMRALKATSRIQPVQGGRAHSLHRAPWLPCAMGRVGRWHTDATCRPEGVNALARPRALHSRETNYGTILAGVGLGSSFQLSTELKIMLNSP